MSSDIKFVEYVVGQFSESCAITYRKMFGEFTLYSKGKVVGLICDNQFFVKPTEEGKRYFIDYTEAPPYPGAKPSLLIQDEIEDSEWLSELIKITEKALPIPKAKKKKKPKK
jgi:TfoX/Sxy family transcriptional regulator of competence genes